MFFNLRIYLLLFFLLSSLGFRFWQVYTQPAPILLHQIKFTGKVLQEPVILGQSQYFQVGNFRIRTKLFPKFHYGDYLEISGTPNETLLISYPEIKKVGVKKDWLSPIFAFRKFLISQAAQIWPQPAASLLTGIILGQDSIDPNFRQALINTGTIHIVVVSGQNVSMLAGLIVASFGRIFRKLTVSILLILTIAFYTLLTGFQPPTVRAAIMGILAFLAKFTGRENLGFAGLATAVFLMLFFDPKLVFNISFQLSTAATFGILFAQGNFEKIFQKFPKVVRDSQSVTISAWIFTAPLIAFYFAQITPVTPFSNLLVLPVVPLLMVAGGATLIISLASQLLAKIAGIFSYILATYFTLVTENLAKIPAATVKFSEFNLFILLAFYILVISVILWLKKLLAKK